MEFRQPLVRGFQLKKPWPRKKKPPIDSAIDTMRSALEVLKESADAFPLLQNTVRSVIAIWDIHTRVKMCKRNVEGLAGRACEVLFGLQEAIGDPEDVLPQMLRSIAQFQRLLDEILGLMEKLASSKYPSRLISLNHDEKRILALKVQLDEMLELFKVCSVARTELCVLEVCNKTSNIEKGIKDIKLVLHEVQSKQELLGDVLSWNSEARRILKLQMASIILF